MWNEDSIIDLILQSSEEDYNGMDSLNKKEDKRYENALLLEEDLEPWIKRHRQTPNSFKREECPIYEHQEYVDEDLKRSFRFQKEFEEEQEKREEEKRVQNQLRKNRRKFKEKQKKRIIERLQKKQRRFSFKVLIKRYRRIKQKQQKKKEIHIRNRQKKKILRQELSYKEIKKITTNREEEKYGKQKSLDYHTSGKENTLKRGEEDEDKTKIIKKTTKNKKQKRRMRNLKSQDQGLINSQVLQSIEKKNKAQDREIIDNVLKLGSKQLTEIMQDIFVTVKDYNVTFTSTQTQNSQTSDYLSFLRKRKLQEPQIIKTDEIYQKLMTGMEELGKLPLTIMTIITDPDLIRKFGFKSDFTEEEIDKIYSKNYEDWNFQSIQQRQQFLVDKKKGGSQIQEDQQMDSFETIKQIALPLVWATTGQAKHIYKGQEALKRNITEARLPVAAEEFFTDLMKEFEKYSTQRTPEELDSMNKRKEITRAWEKGIKAYLDSPIMKREAHLKIMLRLASRDLNTQEKIASIIEEVVHETIIEKARDMAALEAKETGFLVSNELILAKQVQKLRKQQIILERLYAQWAEIGLFRQVSNRVDTKTTMAALSLTLEVVENYFLGTVSMMNLITQLLNEYISPVTIMNFQNEPVNIQATNFIGHKAIEDAFFEITMTDSKLPTKDDEKTKTQKNAVLKGQLQMDKAEEEKNQTQGVFPIQVEIPQAVVSKDNDLRMINISLKNEIMEHRATGMQNFIARARAFTDDKFEKLLTETKFEDLRQTCPIYNQRKFINFMSRAAEILYELDQAKDNTNAKERLEKLNEDESKQSEGEIASMIGRTHQTRITQLETISLVTITLINNIWSHYRVKCKALSQNYLGSVNNSFQLKDIKALNEEGVKIVISMSDISEETIPRAIQIVRDTFETALKQKEIQPQNLSVENREHMYRKMIQRLTGGTHDFLTVGAFQILTAFQQMEFDHEMAQRLMQKEISLQNISFVIDFQSMTGIDYFLSDIIEKQAKEGLRRRLQLRVKEIGQILYKSVLEEENQTKQIISDKEREEIKRLAIENIYFRMITGRYGGSIYKINLGQMGFAYNLDCGRIAHLGEGKPGAGGFFDWFSKVPNIVSGVARTVSPFIQAFAQN